MTKINLIEELPNDPIERERLKDVINSLVESMLRVQDEKDSQKTALDIERNDYSYNPKLLKFYAKMEYDIRYKAEKARKLLEDQADKLGELDILMGR
ncbi:hypothetical protein KLEP7_gp153 [Pseudaeromonas phage vB_PpeM_ KLEP7]|nr:hypothetical protein KLEP7_gp153 [Pseudaeromonas phage vB_PpeM_ KLEP7]